jgi:hypothetical protein
MSIIKKNKLSPHPEERKKMLDGEIAAAYNVSEQSLT